MVYSASWGRRDASSLGHSDSNHVELTLVTPPAVEPVTLTQFKRHARIPWSDDEDSLVMYITAARETIERYLRRALISQQWDFHSDWAPAWVELPKAPIISIDSVFTTDLANVEHVVPPTTYITDLPSALVGLNIGNVWPLHRGKAGFRIRYTCGYGIAKESVPATIRFQILALATAMEANRAQAFPMSTEMKGVLATFRIMGEPFRMARGTSREDLLA